MQLVEFVKFALARREGISLPKKKMASRGFCGNSMLCVSKKSLLFAIVNSELTNVTLEKYDEIILFCLDVLECKHVG